MNLTPYRQVLAVPGLRSLLLVSVLARLPATATALVLTYFVVLDMRRGYFAAGVVGATMTIGAAIGAPLMGRLTDRRGLRPVLLITTAATAAFWVVASLLPYATLVVAAFVGGLLSLPVFSVIRQSIAALVEERQRRQAYALDSMSVELSFMVGPALAVVLVAQISAQITMYVVGVGFVLSGLMLFLLNPPVRADHESAVGMAPVPRRQWLSPRMLGILAATAAATLVLAGTDVSVVAILRDGGELKWTGLVLAMWAVMSLVGGFAYGAVTRPVPPLMLVALLGLCTIPVGLGGGHWWLLCLALIPAGALCAPSLAATADAVSRLSPASVRGEAIGLHGSAITIGTALGAPLAGAVIDAHSAVWGFAATGAVGLAVALATIPVEVRRRRAAVPPCPSPPLAAPPLAAPPLADLALSVGTNHLTSGVSPTKSARSRDEGVRARENE